VRHAFHERPRAPQLEQGGGSRALSIPEASVHDVPVAGEQEAKLDALRSALEAGEHSGPAKPLDFDAFIARKRKSAR